MKISILTTITNPDERQDKWREALACYCDLADEVIVVDGSRVGATDLDPTKGVFADSQWHKLRVFKLEWPYEWNWAELPRHLNAGLEQCTGDWVIKLDIDQFIHEKDFKAVREKLEACPKDCDVATFQKMSMTYGRKYYQKGPMPIAFRRKDYIKIGENLDRKTDLCFPVKYINLFKSAGRKIDYDVPIGNQLKEFKTGISYWNYDYFFKTKEFTFKEFGRFSRAYYRYFKKWAFGEDDKKSFAIFLKGRKGRHDRAPYDYTFIDHPKYIREAVKNLKPEQFGFNAWGLLK